MACSKMAAVTGLTADEAKGKAVADEAAAEESKEIEGVSLGAALGCRGGLGAMMAEG